jgi:acetolactate synthase-1/2/3 large subunit
VTDRSPGSRIGGHLVAESLAALGAEVVFGVPGVHALPMWEGLRSRGVTVIGLRHELDAAFAADGRARVAREPTAVLVSTGPGALLTLPAVLEAWAAFVPLVVVASQIDASAIGQGRGELHESPDQAASFAALVKSTGRATRPEEIPVVLADAWRRAATPPQGPVYVEVPADVLLSPAEGIEVRDLDAAPEVPPLPPAVDLDRAARSLDGAERPLLVAGGGVVRSGAGEEALELAIRLDAPIATTITGKGAISEHHPLALGSAWDEPAHRRLVADADAILVVGSWLGYELRDAFRAFSGSLVEIDAARERIALNAPALGLLGDARAVLGALLERVARRRASGEGARRVAEAKAQIERGLAAERDGTALDLLATIERCLAGGAPAAWDSTILAYAASAYLRADHARSFLYPAGSSTLGYALPAAIGAASVLEEPVLAVVGDGGLQYGLAELAVARQHGLPVAVLVIDDGGYGILRAYQDERGFGHAGVDLVNPDFVALAEAFGLPARRSSPARLDADLGWALSLGGPSMVALELELALPEPCS